MYYRTASETGLGHYLHAKSHPGCAGAGKVVVEMVQGTIGVDTELGRDGKGKIAAVAAHARILPPFLGHIYPPKLL